jgi:hypothetical protein
MDETEVQNLLSKRSGTEQKVYEALRVGGKMTDRQLRDLLKSPGSGPRDALKRLLPLGLVRHAGKAETKNYPMQYEITPPGEVEAERERYAVRQPAKRKTRSVASPGARLAELRQMEPGDPRKWHPDRDKILAALPLLTNTIRTSFWECVPAEELQLALDEIQELHDAAADALAAGRERMEHEKHKAKIEKLERTSGRTAAEKETAARKASKLRRKLLSD